MVRSPVADMFTCVAFALLFGGVITSVSLGWGMIVYALIAIFFVLGTVNWLEQGIFEAHVEMFSDKPKQTGKTSKPRRRNRAKTARR